MKISLSKIKISGFLDIAEDQEYCFESKGMVGVFGKNLDSGSSNGAGKTSFITAIPAAIYGTAFIPHSVKDIKNRYLDVNPRIVLEMVVDGQPFAIDRTFGGSVKIKVGNGEWEAGSAKDMQERINNIIKLTPEQLLALTLKAQGNFGGFLLMKDSEKKDFLSGFFDIKHLEDASDKLKTKASDIRPKLDEISKALIWENSQIDARSGTIDALLREVEALSGLDKKNWINDILSEIHKATVKSKELKVKLASVEDSPEVLTIKRSCEDLIGQISEKRSEAESLKKQFLPEDTAAPVPLEMIEALAAARSKVDEAKIKIDQKAKLSDLLQSQKRSMAVMAEKKQNALKELESIHGKINSLSHNQNCYTCGQSLPESVFASKLKELEDGKRDLESIVEQFNQQIENSNISKLEEALSTFGSAEEELTSAQGLVASIAAEIASFEKNARNTPAKAANDVIRSKIVGINQVAASLERSLMAQQAAASDIVRNTKRAYEAEIVQLEQSVTALQKQIEAHQAYLAGIRSKLDIEQKNLSNSQNKIRGLAQSHSELSLELAVLEKSVNILSRSGFIGYLFDGVLNELNNGTNAILKNIPLVSQFSVYFSPDKVSQSSGNVSKNITHQIYCGSSPVTFESLSGAEKICVVMAVDEALDDVLSQRLGVSASWKILDEQLMYVDEQNKGHILDFLSSRYSQKSLYIVDHASEFNASLEKRIYITKSGGVARIETA
jgi:DNA repair exonuclease SbcCD ATPase subunit